ncbi:hypothetical protein KRX11_04010 [Pasteurellaceae bacterium TAE3-ERU1]|nr:hypothetical protein [Pasteurellaceae bacterium TAE3-ERU1]
MVQSFFGKHFSYEDGKIVVKDEHGNPIFSREKPGELASFDEAIEQIVNEYPYKVVCSTFGTKTLQSSKTRLLGIAKNSKCG